MSKIRLTKEREALVDAEDFERLSKHHWFYNRGGYAVRTMRSHDVVPDQRFSWNWNKAKSRWETTIYMHREVMNHPDDEIDHKNHNGLDNQKSNLRVSTSQQNKRNRQKLKGCSSKYKGVCWHKGAKKWMAVITLGPRKSLYLGLHVAEDEAGRTYDIAAKEHFGEFAVLNFPDANFVNEPQMERTA